MPRPLAILLAVLLPMALAVLVAWPGRSGGWARADIAAVVQNPLVTAPPSPAARVAIVKACLTRGSGDSLSMVSLAWDWHRGGGSPLAFHDTNLLLAAVAAGVLAALAMALGLHPALAGGAASIFAAHAARVDAVIGIAGRDSLCATVFMLATLFVASLRVGVWRYLIVAVLAAAVSLCGPHSLELLVFIACLPGLSRRDRVAGSLVVVVAVLATSWICLSLIGDFHGVFPSVPPEAWAARIVPALAALGLAAVQIAWPARLLLVWDDALPEAPTAGWVALGAFTAALPLVVAWLTRRGRQTEAWALLVMVAPFLALVGTASTASSSASAVFGASALGLPIAGLALAVGALADRIAMRRGVMPTLAGAQAGSGQRLLIATALLALVALALAARSVERARDWQSPHKLALAQLRDAPEMGLSHEMLAFDLLESTAPTTRSDGGDIGVPPAEVLALLAEAVRLDPRRIDALVMLARSRLRQAQALPAGSERAAAFTVAEGLYRRAVLEVPTPRDVNGPLGLICLFTGREAEGEKYLRAELVVNPLDARALANLSMYLDGKDRHDEARTLSETQLAAARAEVAAHPENIAVTRFAAALAARLGRTEEATALYTEAVHHATTAEAIGETVRDLSKHLVGAGKSEEARAAMIEAIARVEAMLPTAESPATVWFVLSRIEVERTNFVRGRECLIEARKLATGPLRTLVDDTLKRLVERDKRDR